MENIRKFYRNRNFATPDIQMQIRIAVRDVLKENGIDPKRIDDYQPMLDNTTYDLVKEFWESGD